MKALAILVVCSAALAVATPSRAFVHAGGGPAPVPVGARPPLGPTGHHDHHGGGGGGGGGWLGGTVAVPEVIPDASATPDAAEAPVADLPPAVLCPAADPAPARRASGPAIIYIDHAPPAQNNLPKVIYGTQ